MVCSKLGYNKTPDKNILIKEITSYMFHIKTKIKICCCYGCQLTAFRENANLLFTNVDKCLMESAQLNVQSPRDVYQKEEYSKCSHSRGCYTIIGT